MRRLDAVVLFVPLSMLGCRNVGGATDYYVAQEEAQASDANPGTRERPFRTLGQACQVATAGDTVYIRQGVYREALIPKHSGEKGKPGLDFWIICDDQKAYLFFTTLDGCLWREETSLSRFPTGWSPPQLALQDDIFEAAHLYRVQGLDRYLAVIEAQSGYGWRYFKAYLADRLEGRWEPLAATKEHAFASMANTEHSDPRWTDCISHGELLRAGYDQRLEVDPARLRFLFQGALDRECEGRGYGQIPWRLGLLEVR